MSPISSDSRVPWINRDSMSRPSGSVPRMNCHDPPSCHTGGTSVKSRYCSLGACGATALANSARKISATTSASPMSAPRLFEYDCQNSRNGSGAASGGVSITTSSMTYPRVHDAVELVYDQFDADYDGRGHLDFDFYDSQCERLIYVDEIVA